MDLYDLFQNARIKESKLRAGQANARADNNEHTIRGLQHQIDHLSLVCQAMSELLSQVGLSKEMLVAKIQELEKKDTQNKPSITCPACQRTLAPRHAMCMYCGAKVDHLNKL